MRALIFGLLVAFLPAKSFAIICVPTDEGNISAVALSEVLHTYLSTMKAGRTEQLNAGLEDAIVTTMINLKAAKKTYECAASQIAPFLKSPDETIRQSAGALFQAAANLSGCIEALITSLRESLDGTSRKGQGTLAEFHADLRIEMDNSWKLIPVSIALVSLAFIDSHASETQKTGKLKFTKHQRDQLIKSFRNLRNTKPSLDDHAIEFSAHLLIKFLDQNWLFASPQVAAHD